MMDTKDDLDERVKKKKRGRPLADYSREEIRYMWEIQLDVIRSVPIHSRQNREGQGRQDTRILINLNSREGGTILRICKAK